MIPEKMHTVGRLAKRFNLSRSTLLYYDSIGLLTPSVHHSGEYRLYSEADATRLEQIVTYRKTGLPLKEIKRVLEAPKSRLATALEERLSELSGEIRTLRSQQRFILRLLGGKAMPEDGALDKKTWTDLLRSSGLNEEDMVRWHSEFERRSPDNHRRFLKLLCIPDEEIETIRSWSRAPQEAARILKLSARQLELLFELFSDTPRQGPGSIETTQKILAMLPTLPKNPAILEVGCGTGGSTLDLARLTNGTITATDVYQPFMDELRRRAKQAGITGITTTKVDMTELDYPDQSFDLIWAESCVFLMGFEAALVAWKRMLRPGGLLVVSDVSWTTATPDQEIRDFWAVGYPGMLDMDAHQAIITTAGYECLGSFIQPESDWEAIYGPLRERRLPLMEAAHPDDDQALELVESTRLEMKLYAKYAQQYGHVVYAIRRP